MGVGVSTVSAINQWFCLRLDKLGINHPRSDDSDRLSDFAKTLKSERLPKRNLGNLFLRRQEAMSVIDQNPGIEMDGVLFKIFREGKLGFVSNTKFEELNFESALFLFRKIEERFGATPESSIILKGLLNDLAEFNLEKREGPKVSILEADIELFIAQGNEMSMLDVPMGSIYKNAFMAIHRAIDTVLDSGWGLESKSMAIQNLNPYMIDYVEADPIKSRIEEELKRLG